MKYISVLFLFVFASPNLPAQIFQRLHAPVVKDDTPMNSPWAGGVNAPQWSAADLNEDGTPDLYAFDRDGHVSMTFINVGEPGEIKYEFAPEYFSSFPTLHDFVHLRDFDQDGSMDIFAYAGDEGIPGIKVYEGFYDGGKLRFDRLGNGSFPLDILTVPLNNGTLSNLNVSRPDYPAVEDVDGDGDLDIISIFSSTGSSLVYYKNMAIEQGFTLDTLIYRTESTCWMGVYIPTLTTSLVLSCHPDSCASSCPDMLLQTESSTDRGPRHGAGTILTHDFDGDGDSELLYGDLQFTHVNFVENNDASGNDWGIAQDSLFPSYDESVLLNKFPASFKIDIDNDGVLEFLFSPNAVGATIRDMNNVFFYENTGTSEMPVLTKVAENLIQRDMIDLGTTAQPAFFDHNADGLMDFVVGNFFTVTESTQQNISFLQLYENVGTVEAPAFTLVDEDYLNFQQFSELGLASAFAPAFGDLDNDGDDDLLVGQKDGTLFFVKNNGGEGNPVNWGPVIPNYKFIDGGQNATPCIFDANNDGLPDLLIGRKLGTISYFQNIGTAEAPDFNPDVEAAPNNIFFGEINTQDQSPTTQQGMTAPVVLEFEDTTYIVTGSEAGYLEVYLHDPAKASAGAFTQVAEQFADYYEGTYSRISFANLNDDDFLDAIVGNHRGGLSLFTSPFRVEGLVIDATTENRPDLDFQIFPNPADEILTLNLGEIFLPGGQFRFYNSLGQVALTGVLASPKMDIPVGRLSPGIYFLEVGMGDMRGVKKVVVK